MGLNTPTSKTGLNTPISRRGLGAPPFAGGGLLTPDLVLVDENGTPLTDESGNQLTI